MFKRNPEDPSVVYFCIGRIRFIFRDGKYVGWYNAKLIRVV